MKQRYLDVNNQQKGRLYKQYWFAADGTFLMHQAIAKPYYHYLQAPNAKKKRWTRNYHCDLEPGTIIIKYVVKGHQRWWEEHEVRETEIVKISDSPGVPPWIAEFVQKMKEAKDERERHADTDSG